jgi:hypothetical protein
MELRLQKKTDVADKSEKQKNSRFFCFGLADAGRDFIGQ